MSTTPAEPPVAFCEVTLDAPSEPVVVTAHRNDKLEPFRTIDAPASAC
jgi:hypothetical protein